MYRWMWGSATSVWSLPAGRTRAVFHRFGVFGLEFMLPCTGEKFLFAIFLAGAPERPAELARPLPFANDGSTKDNLSMLQTSNELMYISRPFGVHL